MLYRRYDDEDLNRLIPDDGREPQQHLPPMPEGALMPTGPAQGMPPPEGALPLPGGGTGIARTPPPEGALPLPGGDTGVARTPPPEGALPLPGGDTGVARTPPPEGALPPQGGIGATRADINRSMDEARERHRLNSMSAPERRDAMLREEMDRFIQQGRQLDPRTGQPLLSDARAAALEAAMGSTNRLQHMTTSTAHGRNVDEVLGIVPGHDQRSAQMRPDDASRVGRRMDGSAKGLTDWLERIKTGQAEQDRAAATHARAGETHDIALQNAQFNQTVTQPAAQSDAAFRKWQQEREKGTWELTAGLREKVFNEGPQPAYSPDGNLLGYHVQDNKGGITFRTHNEASEANHAEKQAARERRDMLRRRIQERGPLPLRAPDGRLIGNYVLDGDGNPVLKSDSLRPEDLLFAMQFGDGMVPGMGDSDNNEQHPRWVDQVDAQHQGRFTADALSGDKQRSTPQAPTAPELPQIGEVRFSRSRGEHVRRVGGDPSDPENWKSVEQQ